MLFSNQLTKQNFRASVENQEERKKIMVYDNAKRAHNNNNGRIVSNSVRISFSIHYSRVIFRSLSDAASYL